MEALTKEQIKAFRKADSVNFAHLETENKFRGEIEIRKDIKAPSYMDTYHDGSARLLIQEVYSRITSYSDKMNRARYTEIFCSQSPEYKTFASCLKVGDELHMEFVHDGKGTPQMKEDGYHVDQFLIKIYRGINTKSPKVLTFCLDTTTYKSYPNGMCM